MVTPSTKAIGGLAGVRSNMAQRLKLRLPKPGDRLLKTASFKVHDKVHCTTASSLTSGIPELRTGQEQFELSTITASMPSGASVLPLRYVSNVSLSVVGEHFEHEDRI